jgi:SPX domain protein involved in polyphosphate accumulation
LICRSPYPLTRLESVRLNAELQLVINSAKNGSAKQWVSSLFLIFLSKEVKRIEDFVTEKLVSLEELLHHSMEKVNKHGIVSFMEVNTGLSKTLQQAKKNRELSVLRAYTSLYQKIEELESFCFLNMILCVKILKKHDKLKESSERTLYPCYLEHVIHRTDFGQWRVGTSYRTAKETNCRVMC